MTTAAKVGITGIDASYYITKDLNKATEFYSNLFGIPPTMQVPDMVTEFTFAGGETFGLYMPEDKSEWRPSGGLLFHVEDIKAARAAAESIGAKFDDHEEETPMCFMAFGQDPEGSMFILHQTKG